MKKILLVCFIVLASSSFAQRIFLDQNFGDSGVVSCKVKSDVQKIVSLPDGKFLCLGIYANNQGTYQPALFKFDCNGKLDSTFSEDGILQDTILKTIYPRGNFLNVQPDGKIFTASYYSNFTYISCYDSNGNPILTFGKSGLLKLDTIENVSNRPMLISFTSCPDNKTIVCWQGFYTKGGSSFGFILARFDSTGCIDRSFGTDGFLFFKLSSTRFRVDAINVFKDSSIICAGSDYTDDVNCRTAIIKLHSDGTFNNNFGIDGKVVFDVDPSDHHDPFENTYLETARNVIELDDHRMIVSTITNKNNRDYLIRLLPDGSIDSTFGNNGISVLLAHITDLAVSNDGRIFTTAQNQFNYFTSNGIAVSSMTLINKQFDQINCINIPDNDNIILGGSILSSNARYYSIAKFNSGPPESVPQIKTQTKEVSIFPLPFKDVISFQSDNSVIRNISIYDLNGKCVLSRTVFDKSCILNTDFARGVYLCKIQTAKCVEYHKLVSTGN